jgi:hypothetical protein
VIRNPAIRLFEPCLKTSCFDTRAARPKISEIGSAGRPLFERCSLASAPLFTLARLGRFLARRRYVRAISAMQNSRVIVSAMGQHIPQRVLSEPVSVPWVAVRKTVNATAYCHGLKIHLAVRQRRVPPIGFIRLLDKRAVIASYRFTSWSAVVVVAHAFTPRQLPRCSLTDRRGRERRPRFGRRGSGDATATVERAITLGARRRSRPRFQDRLFHRNRGRVTPGNPSLQLQSAGRRTRQVPEGDRRRAC